MDVFITTLFVCVCKFPYILTLLQVFTRDDPFEMLIRPLLLKLVKHKGSKRER
jgi:hypothetical protein